MKDNIKRNRIGDISLYFLLTLFMLISFYKMNPNSEPLANDDGVYLYTAIQINDGGAPYVDSWDHKGPIFYLIEVLGLHFAPDPQWGVFIFNAILLAFSFLIFCYTLRQYFSWIAIAGGSIFFLFLFQSFVRNVSAPDYQALYFLMITFSLLIYGEKQKKRWVWGLIGFFAGIVILSKMTAALFYIVLAIYLIIISISQKKLDRRFLLFAIGGLTVSAIAFIFLFQKKALSDFFDQYILFNMIYAGSGSSLTLLKNLLATLFRLTETLGYPISFICIIVYFLTAMLLSETYQKKRSISDFDPIEKLMTLTVFAFPIEIILTGASGKPYYQYFSVMTVYLFFFFCRIIEIIVQHTSWLRTQSLGQYTTLLFCTFFSMSILTQKSLEKIERQGKKIFSKEFFEYTAADSWETRKYLEENTNQNDTVYVWGSAVNINVEIDRKSPTRYTYATPLYNCSYTTIDKWNEFYNDITTKKPKYIVEAEDFPSIKDGAPAGCEHIDDLFNRFMYYFENSYKEVDMTPIDGIRHIYLYSGTD